MTPSHRPRLAAALAATEYQREWFAEHRRRVTAGSPSALVNADAPQEILRAMDIPYVVNQWWASVISAKRQAEASLAVLAEQGYPDDSRQYDALALGAQGLPAEGAPWGGLPRPDFVVCERGGDVAHKIFELWTEHAETEFFCYSRTGGDPAPHRWWELVPHRWEEAFGRERIDLLAAENEQLIEWLERRTGRRLDRARLAEVMALTNEQAEWNRRTRDLIASARPTPIEVTDSIPAVMIPQWHRGTRWAVDAAERLYREVQERVEAGVGVADRERRRLMWIGRGVWGDLDLYRHFQEEFGAVFVWSMYLAIAADGYVRYGDDPVRALAARFVGITDQLYMPPWSAEWYVKEALAHGVDGVVHLAASDTPGSVFITQALEAAGVPVLEIAADNTDPRSVEAARLRERIATFLEARVPALT
ncbi:2-hydroxyacyl-CoA dehydratase family protein [Agromyces sp. NPDC049794]|uniref:2-hydroxyacyl-CoA dehydratase family protein n=1 Tax=unclassified Agromyces TaxID=2639701 RepID=UPI0033C8FFEE